MSTQKTSYRCSAGDTFDLVALKVYGDENYAYALLNANPSLCGVMVFDGGEILTVPVINIPDETQDTGYAPAIAPWKE